MHGVALDLVNGLFEFIGGVCIWMNVRKLLKDKMVRGVSWYVTLFWWSWGVWNLIYYPALNQWMSFSGGLFIVSGNFVWLALAIKYRRN